MFSQQRKLLLLVFLWTCLCIVIYKSSTTRVDYSSKHQKRALTTTTSTATSDTHRQESFSLSSSQQNFTTAAAAKPVAAAQTQNQQENHHNQQQQCQYNYPNLLDLQFNNIHWQTAQTHVLPANNGSSSSSSSKHAAGSVATFYLYNAYYDDRWRGGLPSVRVLAMIDRIHPPPTDCLLWSRKLRESGPDSKLVPLVSRASFVYAWYPKWGNYREGLLQPWIVTCHVPRSHLGLVPDSVSLVPVPPLKSQEEPVIVTSLNKRDVAASSDTQQQQASIAMPASFSSSLPSVSSSSHPQLPSTSSQPATSKRKQHQQHSKPDYDCSHTQKPITNNLPVFNRRPPTKEKFAVCVKGLDFPHEDVSVRLVEWIELLNLLGAGKIFLYELDVHENISKVLHYYQERGMVELSPLTLPGNQPNLPEYQHLYLKSKLTNKRQNELIPYNDCLYRNLNSYQYLALLDIDEIIMPLEHHNWHGLMEEVEKMSLAEQNYSRASYNVRNVYFFDDLAGPLGTTSSSTTSTTASASDEDSLDSAAGEDSEDSSSNSSNRSNEVEEDKQQLERGIPHYLHMMQHVYRSKNYTKPGQYVKCFHNTERVVSLHNHFPMNCFGQCTTYSVPVKLAHLQHYRKDCVGPLKQSCKSDFRKFTQRDTTIWKYKQQMIRRTTRVLNHLGLLGSRSSSSSTGKSPGGSNQNNR